MNARLTVCTLLSVGLVTTANAAATTPYPTKPIRYIVPFAPGGPTDLMSRAIAEKVAEAWGQQVVVDNRAGAGGAIAGELLAKAAQVTFQYRGLLASIYTGD